MWVLHLALPYVTVDGAVLQPARSHAKYKRAAGAENADDRGQHSAAAGWTASDPGGAPESPGSEPAGEVAAEECAKNTRNYQKHPAGPLQLCLFL